MTLTYNALCACCGKRIEFNSKNVVRVTYGYTSKTGRFYCENIDFFHNECDKSFRSPVKESDKSTVSTKSEEKAR